MVHFNLALGFATATSFGTGQYYVTLPYPAKGEYAFREGLLHDLSADNRYHLSGELNAGSSQLLLYVTNNSTANDYDEAFTSAIPVTITTADRFHFSGTYEIEG